MTRLGLALALLATGALWLACQGGVLVKAGNNFPCDFSQPQGTRDGACAPGEVCGVDDLCRAFHYEGPQFEAQPNGAPIPDFGTALQLHPGTLDQPVLALTHRGKLHTGTDDDHGIVLMAGPAAGEATVAAVTLGADTSVTTAPYPGDPGLLFSAAQPADWFATVVGNPMMNNQTVITDPFPDGGGVTTTLRLLGMTVDKGERLRTGGGSAVLLRTDTAMSTAGEFGLGGTYFPLDVPNGCVALPDGGCTSASGELDGGTFHPLEVRYLPLSAPPLQDLLMLGDDGFYLRRAGKLGRVSAPDVAMPPLQGTRPTLRTDVTGSIWAFTRAGGDFGFVQRPLSTWRLDLHGASIQRLWNDCSPCGKNGRILAFTPTLNGAPEVQVLCGNRLAAQTDETFTLTRVVGSAAIDETEDCLLEPADAPFSLSQLNFISARFAPPPLGLTEAVQDDANGGGILLGGKLGQLWGGDSLTDALPFFLERTPVAFGTFETDTGDVVPVALTDRYLALPRVSGLGFEVVDIHKAADVALAENVVVGAMMGLAPGWGVLTSADTAYISAPLDGGQFTLQFGPRLVDGRGGPGLSPYFAEAALAQDGGPLSFVMTANDSLYFTPVPPLLTDTPAVLPGVTPQLTPAPGSPIHSMALERSAVGTDGVNRVRGYLIAGRQLFLFTLDGTPARWTATPILLQGGEPVEVWMDNPLGGLGRVGFSDGEVFTLPGGFLLTNPLPRGDGGMAPQVTDYENLGGWPVAMTTSGLYCAQWEKVGMHLQNRFPDGGEGKAMDWQEVTLPDGGRPWLNQNARVQVVRHPQGDGGFVFALYVYTDQQVLRVGTLER
jgi:hypothetical protein